MPTASGEPAGHRLPTHFYGGVMATTTLAKLLRLQKRITDARTAIKDGDSLKAFTLVESSQRKVNDLIEDLITYKRYYNERNDT